MTTGQRLRVPLKVHGIKWSQFPADMHAWKDDARENFHRGGGNVLWLRSQEHSLSRELRKSQWTRSRKVDPAGAHSLQNRLQKENIFFVWSFCLGAYAALMVPSSSTQKALEGDGRPKTIKDKSASMHT
ncbi:hypothetical protein SELMODRAFT_411486 [Selaginella moellendorffii]|uniref:Uncharacterized protein n=1 Tax=Selaginella moellendorffii TaxID=88036 RepID=D8RI36_SELML|nr:hypothetical protein SELMODRAFT_411486 [Selaginella moellendorffii]